MFENHLTVDCPSRTRSHLGQGVLALKVREKPDKVSLHWHEFSVAILYNRQQTALSSVRSRQARPEFTARDAGTSTEFGVDETRSAYGIIEFTLMPLGQHHRKQARKYQQ